MIININGLLLLLWVAFLTGNRKFCGVKSFKFKYSGSNILARIILFRVAINDDEVQHTIWIQMNVEVKIIAEIWTPKQIWTELFLEHVGVTLLHIHVELMLKCPPQFTQKSF